jgi:hypothetical protein
MTLRLVRCEDARAWDAFAARSPQGSVFCSTAFLDVQAPGYELWLVEEAGRPQLGAVVLTRQGRARAEPAPFALYQGLLFSAKWDELPPHSRPRWALPLCETLLAGLTERYDRLCFTLHPEFSDLRPLQWFNYARPDRGRFSLELAYTGIIDLASDFDDYLASIRPSRRRQWRGAREEGLCASPSADLEVLERLDALTFARQGLSRSDEERTLVGAIARAACSAGFGELLVCRDPAGRALAATLFLFDQRCGYYLIGANDPAARGVHAGGYLFAESLRRCHARGLRRVDVCGVNSPNRGDFKTSFNARPVPYFVASWPR